MCFFYDYYVLVNCNNYFFFDVIVVGYVIYELGMFEFWNNWDVK